MFVGIVVGLIASVLVGGFVLDRRDKKKGTGRSRGASSMTKSAMRHRQQYGRKGGR